MDKYVSDNPQSNMETAINLFYIKDGETWVRGVGIKGEDETLCNFIRLIADEHPMLDFVVSTDEALSENMYDLLADGITTDEGIVALLYQAAWAFSVLRERVKQYEEIGLNPEEIAVYKKAFEIAVRCAREEVSTTELIEAYDSAQHNDRGLNKFRAFCLEKAKEELQEVVE